MKLQGKIKQSLHPSGSALSIQNEPYPTLLKPFNDSKKELMCCDMEKSRKSKSQKLGCSGYQRPDFRSKPELYECFFFHIR